MPRALSKSGSKRLDVEEPTGDPGAYDPNANRDLAHQAMSSFGRSNRAGSGASTAAQARRATPAISSAVPTTSGRRFSS